jgi:hypothetical protein
MAREKKPSYAPLQPQQQEEMTVVVVKFKGGAESMQKGFDAVNNAIAALGPTQPVQQRVIVTRPPAQIPAAPAQDGHVIDAETQDIADEPEAVEQTQETPAASNGKPKKPLAPHQSFLSDFNLTPAGAPSWKEFAGGRNPQTENDKFLIASLWIQTHGGVDPFTGSHLFTCFRAMEWKTQVDMVQPLRALKSKKSYYENPGHGKWKLTAGAGVPAAEKVGKE